MIRINTDYLNEKMAAKKNILSKPFKYFSESITELKKVSWPTSREAINLTITVVAISVLIGLFLGFFDLVFGKALNFLLKK